VTRRSLPILLALAATLLPAAPASGRQLSIYEKMVVDIVDDQRLDACKYTTDQLKKAKAYIPLDAQQYNVAFVAAFDDAIAFRSQGGCNKAKQQAQKQTQAAPQVTATPPAGQAPPPPPPSATKAATAVAGVPAQAQAPPTPQSEPAPAAAISVDDSIALASHTTAVATDAPFPVLALAILAGVLALAALAFGVVRWFAWEPAWAVRFRHAAGEAGWRASSTFAEFTDFVRLGR
jgi:hypothetical protein